MSSVAILQRKDVLLMGCDSASSTLVNGEYYRVDELARKIHVIDNKAIFISGDQALSGEIIKRFEVMKHRTIEQLRDITRDVFNKFSGFSTSDLCPVNVVVGTFEDIGTVVYHFSPTTNFEIKKHIGEDYIKVMTSGINQEESLPIMKREYLKDIEVSEIYQNTFDEISFEAIGGTLNVLMIDAEGVKLYYQNQIKDKEKLRKVSPIHHADANGNLNLTGIVSATDLKLNGTSILASINQIQGSAIGTGINGSNITAGSINANLITTGSLDASKITVKNLSATSINSGTIDAQYISTNISQVNSQLRIGNAGQTGQSILINDNCSISNPSNTDSMRLSGLILDCSGGEGVYVNTASGLKVVATRDWVQSNNVAVFG